MKFKQILIITSLLAITACTGNNTPELEKITPIIKETENWQHLDQEYKLINHNNHNIKFDWVIIPAGDFIMGSNDGQHDEKPIHKVYITKSFHLSRTPVTFDQYDKFCEATGRTKPEDSPKNKEWGRGSQPVINITWNDATAFCEWAGVRLPTEAEWEYACRANTNTKYYWGERIKDEYCWWEENSKGKPQAVGQKRPNAWGLYDMAGNVWEWVFDVKAQYTDKEQEDPTGPQSGNIRVIRGGCWSDREDYCTSSCRFPAQQNYKDTSIGFRVAK